MIAEGYTDPYGRFCTRWLIFPLASIVSPGSMPAGQGPTYFWSMIIVVELIPPKAGL